MELKIIDQIQQTAKEVEVQLPVLKAVNPIQSTIIGGTLSKIESISQKCYALFDENMITKYKLGFKNERSVAEFYKSVVYNGFLTFFSTYLKIIKDFGESTILIPFGLFNKILDEYGLISGSLGRYTGEVPHHVTQAIIDANNYCPSYVSKLCAISGLTFRVGCSDSDKNEAMEVINKFPFYRKFIDYKDVFDRIDQSNAFEKFYDGKSYYIDRWENEEQTSHLFIAAPAHEMIPLEITKTVPRKTSDPLVCSFIPHIGIIVHTSWGPEGKDIVLTLYRKLSQILKMISENEIIQTIFNNCEFEDYKPSKMAFDFYSKF